MDNSFSINRVGLLLKRDFVEGKKQLGVAVLALFAAISLVFILFSPLFVQGEVGVFFSTFLVVWMYSIGICISASLMFGPMRTKQGRVNLFMLPATVSEKYVEQILIYVVGFTLVFFGCVFLAEAFRCMVAPWLFGETSSGELGRFINHFVVPEFFIEKTGASTSAFALIAVASTLSSIGMYALGAALWPKYSFLKMMAASYVVSLVIGVAEFIGMAIMSSRNIEIEPKAVIYAIIGILPVVAVCTLTASYIVFSRKNVIS